MGNAAFCAHTVQIYLKQLSGYLSHSKRKVLTYFNTIMDGGGGGEIFPQRGFLHTAQKPLGVGS